MMTPLPPVIDFKLLSEPLAYQFRPLTAPNTLFLDRDGVLISAVMRGAEVSSARNLGEVKLNEDITALADPEIWQKWNLVMVSNQPDLARGSIGLEFIERVNGMLNERIPLNAAYICPHQHADGCECRKPRAGLIRTFRSQHPECQGRELMVGDRGNDRDCAVSAGMQFVLCKRPYNEELAGLAMQSINSLWELKTL